MKPVKTLKTVTTAQPFAYFSPDDLVIIGLDTEDGDTHPLADPRAHGPADPALVRSIIRHGILEPVVVRKGPNGRAEVVDGRRRVIAARAVPSVDPEAKIVIPVIVRDGDDLAAAGAMVAANEIRQEDSYASRASKIARLQEMGMSIDDVAVEFGASGQTIRNILKLAAAAKSVRDAVDRGKISATAGYRIATLKTEEEQAAALAALLESGDPTAAGAARKARKLREGGEGDDDAPKPIRVPYSLAQRVLDTIAEWGDEAGTDPAVAAVLAWIVGAGSPKRVKGLSAILAAIDKADVEDEAEKARLKEERAKAREERAARRAEEKAAKKKLPPPRRIPKSAPVTDVDPDEPGDDWGDDSEE